MALALFNSGRSLLNMHRKSRDEDAVMRLFSRVTPTLLILMVIIITPRQFFSNPINCWQMGSFFPSYASYAERKCLVSGTYYVPDNQNVETYNTEKKLRWYLFTTVFIAMNTIAFIMPTIIWNGFNSQGGIEVSKVTDAAEIFQNFADNSSSQDRESILHYICENLNLVQKHKSSYVTIKNVPNSRVKRLRYACTQCACFSRFNTSYLANLTLVVKILHILAVPFNFFLISSFIGSGYWTLGFRFFFRIGSGNSVFFNEMFPLQTMCTFMVRTNMHPEPKKLQCLLTMNIFNEKVFLIIWFWYIFLLLIGIINLISWTIFRYSSRYRYEYFRKYLPSAKNKRETVVLMRFFQEFLTPDCSFALRLLMEHVDNLTMTILARGLFDLYKREITKVSINQQVEKEDEFSEEMMFANEAIVDDENLHLMDDVANEM